VTAIEDAVTDATARDSTKHVPGEPDMWFFVFFESMVFVSYFCVYLYSRAQHERAFLQAQSHLTPWLGVLDTIVLLTSSMAMALCVQHARAGRHQVARRLVYVTAALGVAFLALKLVEWVKLIHSGQTFTKNQFTQYYFFLTGMHTIHLLIGFVVLGILVYQLSNPERRSQQTIETCATYWHTVDVYWIMIFAVLYVVR
jgi:nitric oxide reductase NorE protein